MEWLYLQLEACQFVKTMSKYVPSDGIVVRQGHPKLPGTQRCHLIKCSAAGHTHNLYHPIIQKAIIEHISIKLWPLVTIAYSLQITHSLVRWNPLSFAKNSLSRTSKNVTSQMPETMHSSSNNGCPYLIMWKQRPVSRKRKKDKANKIAWVSTPLNLFVKRPRVRQHQHLTTTDSEFPYPLPPLRLTHPVKCR